MRRTRRAVTSLAAGALLLTLASCGQDSSTEPEMAVSSPAGEPTARSTERDPLADAVEDLAKNLPVPTVDESQLGAPTDAPTIDYEVDYGLTDPTYGADISWPQCGKGVGPIKERQGLGMPMPLPEWKFVVIGLTNGPAMTRNPCLAEQLAWAKQTDVLVSTYAVATYPSAEQLAKYGDQGPYDSSTQEGKLSNWGYAQGIFNLTTLYELQIPVPGVWIDVEPVPSPPLVAWSKDTDANAAVVRGIARAYRENDYRVGVYSTPNLWRTVVGNLRLGVPEWRAAGQTSEQEAVKRCRGESIQGGEAVLGQWVEDRRDRNVTCPFQVGQLSHWFVQL
ncbi:hypothetical protein [Nocardioides sp. AE5]|uniref:hypothetical protein n=1 Tax=Nocardioides sp. AE5 TaxID=2962573 RepID=UPI0028822077|nr:hypothetical protein [Nocardioides sp. AE5]MDT0203492.1 hypothetical protein [Nocardioides sp. AE5]